MIDLQEEYDEVKECIYKDEHYSVHNNGSVMRHRRKGVRKRKLDDVWSFGESNSTGYLYFGNERVHRIVATAFHGPAPSDKHVVDHIDTNRQNNRPENLRWLTRLENILNNEITRKKVELICGSIEAFLKNPSLLYGHESEDKNFSWMRNVTLEEARISLARLTEWSKSPLKPEGGSLGDWVFQNQSNQHNSSPAEPTKKPSTDMDDWKKIQELGVLLLTGKIPSDAGSKEESKTEEQIEPLRTESLTKNAVQLNWKYPMLFPCCPQQPSGNPLEAYMANLKEGKVFSFNDWGKSFVLQFGIPQAECLWVMCDINIGFKTHAFTKITFKDGIFYHENKGVYDEGDEPEELFDIIMKGGTI
jgi:hypothetical protein